MCYVNLFFPDLTEGGHAPPQRLREFKLAQQWLNVALPAFFKAWAPPSNFVDFFRLFLGLVAFFFFFPLGGWGSPCRVFLLPPVSVVFCFLWVGWVPLPCFPGGFPVSFLPCRIGLGQDGLPTRKPPGPPRPFPWRVCPHPSPAGSRRVDAPR